MELRECSQKGPECELRCFPLQSASWSSNTGHGTMSLLPLTQTIVSGRGQAEGLSFSRNPMQKRPPFCNPRWPSSLFLQSPCTFCTCCRAPGQQLFHIIFRKSNKRVLPAGFTNWMVLFQIKKQKQTWIAKGDRIIHLWVGSHPNLLWGLFYSAYGNFQTANWGRGRDSISWRLLESLRHEAARAVTVLAACTCFPVLI